MSRSPARSWQASLGASRRPSTPRSSSSEPPCRADHQAGRTPARTLFSESSVAPAMGSRPGPLQHAAKQAAARMMAGSPPPEQLEKARELFLLAEDGPGAKEAASRLGGALQVRAEAADRDGDLGGAVSAYADAASAFHVAGAEREARACAERLLAKW